MWLQLAAAASLALLPHARWSPAQQAARRDADSARVNREARDAQVDFELRRRRLLPIVPGGSRGRCDVRLGRFCYWHDDGEMKPPDEPVPIATERRQLTERLDSLARLAPSDGWIAGQRVRYLVEAGRHADAVEVAADCTAEMWWCRALEGFVLHAKGERAGADSAFDAALGAMALDERCAWEELSTLLPPRTASRYRKLPCAGRRALGDTIWWLSQPFWSVDGNDRRAEHYARHVMSRLERDSRSPYQMRWGTDTHELLVRYGWPTAWSRDFGSLHDMTAGNVIGHEPHPSFDFIPDDSALAAPAAAAPGGWRLRNPDAPSRYAPREARAFVSLDPQLVRFPRGDSLLLVAVSDVRGDTVLQKDGATGALAISRGPGEAPAVAREAVVGGRLVVRLTTANAAALASVELRDTVVREAGRARLGFAPLESADGRGTRMSDLLLYESPRGDDASLDAVLPRALGRMEIARGARVGAYWELVRDTPAPDSVTYTLTVTPRETSWLRRAASRLRLATRPAPVHVRFTEPIGGDSVTARGLAFDLSRLSEGRYDVRLRAETARGEVASAERSVRIRRR